MYVCVCGCSEFTQHKVFYPGVLHDYFWSPIYYKAMSLQPYLAENYTVDEELQPY